MHETHVISLELTLGLAFHLLIVIDSGKASSSLGMDYCPYAGKDASTSADLDIEAVFDPPLCNDIEMSGKPFDLRISIFFATVNMFICVYVA